MPKEQGTGNSGSKGVTGLNLRRAFPLAPPIPSSHQRGEREELSRLSDPERSSRRQGRGQEAQFRQSKVCAFDKDRLQRRGYLHEDRFSRKDEHLCRLQRTCLRPHVEP